ncbi:MAG: TAXI family TRAP transporter solute-binding subunit [Pseudomonadota bacterium]
MNETRRLLLLAGLAATAGCATQPAAPVAPTLKSTGIYSAGQGSAFLPYAQGLAQYLTARGLPATGLVTRGSIENLQLIDAETGRLGTAFLGTAFEAVNGSAAWTQGRKHSNVRALFPMYETSFQIVALRSAGLVNLRSLAGKRVGVGPAGGPAESFFKGLADAVGLQAQVVTGTPAALADDLLAGRIDALWQGAALPIPAIRQVADATDAVVFGLTDDELAAMLKRFPFLSPATVAPDTYRNQRTALKSVAAWNFVMAHKDLPEADAYWITRTVLSAADPKAIHDSAGPTRAGNAPNNTVVPFHPGALRYYRERGIQGLK